MKTLRRASSVITALLCTLVFGSTAVAVPPTITQQGRLLDRSGEPLTGQHTLGFAMYDADTGGTTLWEGEVSVDLGDTGFYSVVLGDDSNPLSGEKLAGDDVWLTLSVDGADEMEPRMKLTSVPYALRSGQADSVAAGAIDTDALADGAVTSDDIDSLDWSKVNGVPADLADGDDDTLAAMSCQSGELAGFDGADWTCVTDQDTTYTGDDFVPSGQTCPLGDVAIGMDAAGQLLCAPDANTTYDGTSFALSDQSCPSGERAVGVDASGNLVCEAAPSPFPSGMIAFFPGACPTGWAEYTALQGRVVMGTPSGGTDEAAAGTALADQGSRTITDVPAHAHSVDPPSVSTSSSGAHRHGISTRQDDYNVSGGNGPSFGADNGAYAPRHNTDFAGSHSHGVDVPAFQSGSSGTSAVDVTMPYVQLRACQAP